MSFRAAESEGSIFITQETESVIGSFEASERRYRRVFETAQEGILLVEFDTGKILDVNKYLIDLLGFSKTELLDKYLWDIGIFKDIAASKDNFKELQAKKYARYDDLPLETKEEKTIAVEFISNVYEIDDAKIIQCNIREITERKIRDKLLLETSETYESIANMSPYAIVIYRDGKLEYVNPKGMSLLGANSETEIIGQPIIRFIHPSHLAVVADRLKNMADVGSVAKPLGEVFLRLDGTPMEVEVVTTRLKHKGENVFLSIIVDISERRKAEEALQKREKDLQLLVDNAPEPIFIEAGKRFAYANAAALKLFGAQSRDQLIGRPFIERIHQDYRTAIEERVKQLYEKQEVISPMEQKYLRLDDSVMDVEVSAVPYEYKGQSAALVFVSDITERKKVDEELKKIDEKKTDFIAIASHELRSPLMGIDTGIELVLGRTKGEINQKQEDSLNVAKRSVNRLNRLVDGLLDISKIEAGKIDIKPQAVDLVKAAEDMINQLKPQADEKKVDLGITNRPEKSFEVLADPDKLNEIFTNLISNAIKYTGESGKISIEIADKGAHGEVSVVDNGTGISKEDFPKLFKKFEQFNRAQGPGPKGTGLGLAITKGIVENQGGKISAVSEPGQGSKFSFTVPKKKG